MALQTCAAFLPTLHSGAAQTRYRSRFPNMRRAQTLLNLLRAFLSRLKQERIPTLATLFVSAFILIGLLVFIGVLMTVGVINSKAKAAGVSERPGTLAGTDGGAS